MTARIAGAFVGIALGMGLGSAYVAVADGGYCWLEGVVYEYTYIIYDSDPEINGAFGVVVDDTTRLEFPDGSWITYQSVSEKPLNEDPEPED